MDSMDFKIGIEDVGVAVLQELWNKVTLQALELVSETRDMVLEKGSFQQFSTSISELNMLLQSLNTMEVQAAMGSEPTKAALETLNSKLRKACKIITDYKSGSSFRLVLQSHSVLLQMQDLAKEIAKTISSFQLVNLDVTLSLKFKTDQIISNLRSMQFQSAVETETIASEIEKLMTQNGRNQQNAIKLLKKIADAVGKSANASMVQNELALLKQEKEEMEVQKKQAESLQLSQLIQLLNSTEIVMSRQDEDIAIYHQQYLIESFKCPLCNEIMTDPVAINCGHSFERQAIQEHFDRGERTCPTCGLELLSQELTPNLSLRSSIEEWKVRDMDLKFQAAIPGITSNDHFVQNKALEDMQVLMEIPHYTEKVAQEGLVTKFVEILKDNRLNRIAALKCLYHLAKYSKNNKEAIVDAGAIRRIVKNLYEGEAVTVAVAILLELSVNETLGEKIGNTKDCIPLLVSLLNDKTPVISQKADKVLQSLTFNTHFVVKMAEAGHFQPFVACFNKGPQETRASMAADLIKMQLKDNSIKDLKDKQFIHNLVQMLSSSTPACKSAGLKSIKKLVAHQKIVKQLLADPATIPLLIGIISFDRSGPYWKQEAVEILASLVEASKFSELQGYQGLRELQSQHNVSLFLQLVADSDPQTKVQFLQLLVVLSSKSETVQNLVRSDKDATGHLFSSLDNDQPMVRRWAMKLIYCVSNGHPAGVPLPPSPAKENVVTTLAAIFTNSPDVEDRSTAAGIISQLPADDIIIDEILRKSEALKAIHEVICSTDQEYNWIKSPPELGSSLLENALAALLRGTSLAKQRTATALANLSLSTSLSVFDTTIMAKQASNSVPQLMKLFPSIYKCCSASSENQNLCSVHGSACSPRHTFCLVKADAVKPLVQSLSDTDSGVAEAALMALETLLTDQNTLSHAAATIVDNQGVVAILQVLEKGSSSPKSRALHLFQKILEHTQISNPLFQRSERILIQLLQDDTLKKKAALVLKQMNIITEQSSYF
ncbi:hypothetical protein F0562_032305 [Nyssa sinensis]|uniref:RING-type E3 ubiquitin transferase n=1 Tax=Nyssa sinensis TaxID=561372 RepID=A0A5J5ARB1_9ASTE|nr:hypothetical protein F0562_032305 [Nyssa sinensis]